MFFFRSVCEYFHSPWLKGFECWFTCWFWSIIGNCIYHPVVWGLKKIVYIRDLEKINRLFYKSRWLEKKGISKGRLRWNCKDKTRKTRQDSLFPMKENLQRPFDISRGHYKKTESRKQKTLKTRHSQHTPHSPYTQKTTHSPHPTQPPKRTVSQFSEHS